MNFFDFLNSINSTKVDLIKEDPLNEKDYNAFMINRGLSYFPDTLMFANEMNRFHGIDKKWQYAFYLNGVSKKKRFSKWAKKEKQSEDVELVMKALGYSQSKALSALSLLTEEQLKDIRSNFNQGGR